MAAVARNVAIVIDLEWTYQHHHGVFKGIQEYARRNQGWKCLLSPWLDPSDLDKRNRGKPAIDGIVARATPQLAADARKRRIPLVNVQMGLALPGVPAVYPDRAATGRMAAEHLVARGFRQFSYVGFQPCQNTQYQLRSFREALKAGGHSCSSFFAKYNFSSTRSRWTRFTQGMNELIDTWEPPVGVHVTVDILGRYLIELCLRRGLRVPDDVAVVGAQNEQVVCVQSEPTMTSIDLDYPRVGYEAARLLQRLMDGETPPTEPILVQPKELIARRSTDAQAVGDPLVISALRIISQRSHEFIGVDDIAAAVAATRRTLERRFQASLQCGVAQEITRMRIDRVKRLLAETDTPLKILAGESGFRHEKQMIRTFARLMGETPSAYRRKWRSRSS